MSFEPAPTNAPPLSFDPVFREPTFDVIETLPSLAAERLRLLRQRSADLHAVVPAFEQVHEASMERIEASNALKRLTDHPSVGGFGLSPGGDRQVVVAQQRLDKASAEFERLKQLQEVRTAAWQSASRALQNVETWLRDGRPRGTALEDDEAEPPKLSKGETVVDGIERLRRRCRELRADLHRIESAPHPSAHCKRRMREQIEALAQRGAVNVSGLVEHDGDLVWPTQHVRVDVHNAQPGAVGFAEVVDAGALLAWLHKPALIAALDAEIVNEADDKSALSHEDREKAEAETMADLLAVERDEAMLVWRAQSEGAPCEHRADISPVALLGLRLIAAPRASAPRSSPGHAYDIAAGR